MNATIDIAMGFDRAYAPHAANVMASIVRHAPGASFRFILLQTDVPAELRQRIETTAPGAQFVWVEVGDDDVPEHETRGHLNRAVLFRLGLEKLAPADCERVLYIDSDTIVLGDVRELWRTDLGGSPVGAVTDCYQDAVKFGEDWSLSPGGRYFNSGVMLIDLARVRAEKLFTATLAFVVAHDSKLRYSDQDALNAVFWKNVAPLDATWNVQRYLTLDEVTGERAPDRQWRHPTPKLIHYIGAEKPWMRNVWHPWAWMYWENMKRLPFARDIRQAFGMDFLQMMRMRLRWWLRRPGRKALFEIAPR